MASYSSGVTNSNIVSPEMLQGSSQTELQTMYTARVSALDHTRMTVLDSALRLVLFHFLDCITRDINPKYHSEPFYYIYKSSTE